MSTHLSTAVGILPRRFAPVVAPAAGVREIPGVSPRPAWLLVRARPRPIEAAIAAAALGPGDTKAIAVAREMGSATVLRDDLKARRLAARLGLAVIGTVGVLLAAKRHGFPATVRPDIEALLAARFHLSPDLVAEALADVGEGG